MPQVALTPDQAALYPELSQLQDQLQSVQEAEAKLRRHIFYQDGGRDELTSSVAGHVGFSY